MQFFKKISIFIAVIFPSIALGADKLHIPGYTPATTYDTQGSDLAKFLTAFYKLSLGIAGVAAVVVLIIAGIYYVTAGGDTNKEAKAKEYISNAVSGLLVILLAFLILLTINPKLARVSLPELPFFDATSIAGGGTGATANANMNLEGSNSQTGGGGGF